MSIENILALQADLSALVQAVGPEMEAGFSHYAKDESGKEIKDEDGDAVMCDGDVEGCSTCQAWQDAVEASEGLVQDILLALKKGEVKTALTAAQEGREIEDAFGDSPAWTPVVEALELLADHDNPWVVVRWVPEYQRGSAAAAGHSDGYAVHFITPSGFAEILVDDDDPWAKIVDVDVCDLTAHEVWLPE